MEQKNSQEETNYLLAGKNGEILLESIQEIENGEIIRHALIEE